MKILLLDIETSPNTAHCWGLFNQNIAITQVLESSYVLCWAAKWLGDETIMWRRAYGKQGRYRKDMLRTIHRLLDQADAIVHYNGCVAPGNRVLTKDLRWVDVGSVKIGDELLAFEEYPTSRKGRKFKCSTVEHVSFIEKPCSRITWSNGVSIVASNDHPWLAFSTPSSRNHIYRFNESMMGQKGMTIMPVWEESNDYHAGYLSAFFDGEGCLSQVRRFREKKINNEYVFSCVFSQKDKGIIKKLETSLLHHHIKYTVTSYDKNHPDMNVIRITGGVAECLRFLGMVRPQKLTRIDYEKLEASAVMGLEDVDVVAVEPVGVQTVVGLQTSSRTYIVEGFGCHNSRFDIPTLNKEFLLYNLQRPSPSKQIDLLQVTRNQFKFTSNKLDYVVQALKLGEKVKHRGHELWLGCMNNDLDCWKEMEQYNKHDVVILEKLYHRLLPWIKTHASYSAHQGKPVCPNCGSGQTHRRGYAIAVSGRYPRYQCQACGSWYRGSKVAVKGQERMIAL